MSVLNVFLVSVYNVYKFNEMFQGYSEQEWTTWKQHLILMIF